MAKVKKGDVFSCNACGLVVTVDEACGCATSELICCEEPMGKGKAAAAKARKAAGGAAPVKPVAKKSNVKSTAAKAAPKKAAAKKPAAKPKTAKKK